MTEVGFPGLVVEDWVGFAVKSGTPTEVIARLNQAINQALTKPKIRDAFGKIGAEPAGGTPAELGQLIGSQVAHWAAVVKQAEIKLPQ